MLNQKILKKNRNIYPNLKKSKIPYLRRQLGKNTTYTQGKLRITIRILAKSSVNSFDKILIIVSYRMIRIFNHF